MTVKCIACDRIAPPQVEALLDGHQWSCSPECSRVPLQCREDDTDPGKAFFLDELELDDEGFPF